jgi:siroheme synthase
MSRAALEVLAGADAVVYDRPSLGHVVALAPEGAARLMVGGGRDALPQEEVNALLVALAAEHEHVVRLKSGDPFVASRGGEEARALTAAGVEVSVTPGVSAALAAPAAAGIPLMLRTLSASLTVVDGNVDQDWETFAKLKGTLVILTGRARIRRIAARLIAGGMAGETPIAAISGATRPEQRVERGTLAALPTPLPPPVTFVVGEVAALEVARAHS